MMFAIFKILLAIIIFLIAAFYILTWYFLPFDEEDRNTR
jgi:hypothetical protein